MLAFALAIVGARDDERTRHYDQRVNHFDPADSSTFKQRYYVNTSAFAASGPLFFIPGGEWAVGPTKGVLYGMVHELATQHGGLMAIAEHRFYGESIPRGADVPTAADLSLLTIEQALADYAAVIRQVLLDHGLQPGVTPVVCIGGSYSGKLSAYLRLKYPFLVSAALAASAPIRLDSTGLVDPEAYYGVVERAAERIAPGCPAAVLGQFKALAAVPRGEVAGLLGLCDEAQPPATEFGWDALEFYLTQYFATVRSAAAAPPPAR